MDEKELLFSEVLHCDRISLYLKGKSALAKEKSVFISSVLKRRFSGEPLQYILDKTEFMGLAFRVNQDVFIPRPETEILVETAIKLVVSCPMPAGRQELSVVRPKILDLGTGSGCIAISLAKFLPE
ncbi:MAG: peptide chain release factor N(5)-glutamine methyltransferase, partial [Candidatus Omnitrophica bacterium]|nr:peptide chain release factor N(5)-glutamine methyltransferase [Candidatus Omnitrophota bacterium]